MRGRSIALIVGLCGAVVAAGLGGAWWLGQSGDRTSTGPDPTLASIQHVFIVVQENHAFDNYFGQYCPASGGPCSTAVDGTPANACIPISLLDPTNGCVSPFYFPASTDLHGDLPHEIGQYTTSYDHGRMDGFVQADNGNTTPMGYYDATSVSSYWDIAQQYALGDHFFSGALAASLANHWLLVSGTAPPAAYLGDLADFVKNHTLTTLGQQYLNQANGTPTLPDELLRSNTSWKIYDYPVPVGGYATFLNNSATAATPTMTPFDEFDPLLAKASTFTAPYTSHLVSRYAFGPDLESGQAPNVSWVFPDFPESEHPPGNPTGGESWSMSVINAIERSVVWNSSVIFLTWDEGGGWYDHVAPPGENGTTPGFRVPFLVISPYARENFVSHQFASFGSIDRFIEDRFGLVSLGAADQNAPSLSPYFDFTLTPRAPINFQVNETYPQVLQPLSHRNASGSPTPVTAGELPPTGPAAISWSLATARPARP